MRVLLLGGTAEARALAAALHPRVEVVSSLAGRVSEPRLPVGELRVGGFGGVDGLVAYLGAERIAAMVDATHPFAAGISANAAAASAACGVPLLSLRRPGWQAGKGDDWRWVASVPEAATRADELARRVFVTTGRGDLAGFAGVRAWCLIRCVEPPEPPLPARHSVLLDRGPYTHEGELGLLREHGIEALVTKDSGGAHTAAKLSAARARGIPVIVVTRPRAPDGVPDVSTVDDAVRWVLDRAGAC